MTSNQIQRMQYLKRVLTDPEYPTLPPVEHLRLTKELESLRQIAQDEEDELEIGDRYGKFTHV